jgi:hypothetical protein
MNGMRAAGSLRNSGEIVPSTPVDFDIGCA